MANESNYLMSDENYNPTIIARTSSDGSLTYVPKKWESNEIIDTIEMNNIEQGIQIALEQTSTIQDISETAINNIINYYLNTVLPALNDFSTAMDNLPTTIATQVNGNLATNNSNIITTLSNLLGTNYVATTDTLPVTLGANMSTVDARLVELYNTLFNNGTDKLADLDTFVRGANNTSSLNAKVIALQNELGGSNGNTSFKSKIENAMGRPLEPTAAQISANSNLNSSLLTLIESLQTNLNSLETDLGLGENQSGQLSLIDKIEGMVGRSLDLGNNETIDQQTGEYSNSVMSLIEEIRGILGLDGASSPSQSSSSLLDTIEALTLAVYGTTDISDVTLEESLNNLEEDFYHITVSDGTNEITQSAAILLETLYPIVYEVREANEELEDTVSSYSAIIEHVTDAYVDATTLPIGENDYLVLKRDKTAQEAQNEQDIVDNEYLNNTYIILPKGGGGGGAVIYPQYSIFNVVRPAGTPIIAQGSPYTIFYKWITRDSDTNEDSSGVIGTLRLYKDNTLLATTPITSVITNGNYSELIVTDYITLGTNNFRITITSDVTLSKSFYYTIESVEPRLTSSFNPETIQNNDLISFSFTMSIGNTSINKVLHILIDGVAQTFSSYNQTSERIQTITFTTPSNGGHRLTAYFTSSINGETITSNVLNYGIICGILNQSYIATDFEPNTQIEQYSNLILNYLARTPRSNTTPVTITITDAEENVYVNYDTIASTSYERWSYILNIPIAEMSDSLQLYITLRVNNSEENKIVIPFTLLKNNQYDFSPITTNLRLYLTADQKSNTSASRNVWENSSTAIDKVNVSASLSNFLFYRNVDGWQRDKDDKYYLKLRNKARVEVPFSIFNFEQSGGNITDGMTFEIEFKTEDVLNYDTICIACYDPSDVENGYIRRGIILSPQNSRFQANVSTNIINSGNSGEEGLTRTNILNVYYKEEEKMTIDFVINKTTGNTNTNENALMYIYINGILSGATPYTNIANFSNGKIVIGSDQCTTNIYSIRYYSRALDYREILQNWISNEGNFERRVTLYNKNTYTAANDTELFAQFKEKSPTTSYMVIMTDGDLNDSIYMPIQKGSEYSKDADFYFYDPLDTTNNIGAIATDSTLIGLYGQGKMKVQVQGTSSQYYYRKNYKLKFTTFTQNGVLHKSKKALTDSDYDIVYETQIDSETGEEQQVEVSRTLKSGLSKTGYKLSSTSYPTWTFCIKADVASSESANNTKLTMLYDELSRNFYLTPPQEQDSSIRQGIEGRPVVAWYYNKTTSQYTLLGKYNFNNDKDTNEVYGLEGDTSEPWAGDQSWEVKNNGESPLTLFNYNNENIWNEWQNAFEARFPDQDDTIEDLTGSDATGITDVSAEERAKWIAGLKQAVKWVNDTVELTTLDNSGNDIEATDGCIAAFKAEFENYFNLNAMLFFYVFTEFFLMVDNRAKNMFLTRYIINSSRPSSYDVNSLTTDGTSNANYFGWFSFPYDFDTALGIDNNGRIRFDYHYEDSDLQPDGTSVIFNGQRSKLWKAFKKAYASEIKNMYISFSSRISDTYVENLFETHQSVWSEAIFNEDMIHKYIDWGQAYLYMLLGSKESHRKWWLTNRFRYFNSKYQVGKNQDRIYLRVAPRNYSLNVSTYADSYINIEIGANGTPRTVRVPRGTSQILSYTYNEQDQQTGIDGIETIIYPASALNSISGIASLQAREADFSHANRLETLKLGDATTINTNLSTLTLGQNAILRHFDMRNYSGYSTDLNLSNYISLETVYLSGTNIPTVGLPNGGILVTIQYPTSISEIKIENQPYLENLIIGAFLPADEITDAEHEVSATNQIFDFSNINSLYLDNVGIIDEVNHTNSIDSAAIVDQMATGKALYLNNFIWNMTSTEFVNLYNKIITMHGFTEGVEDATTKPYLNGSVYVTGELSEEFINHINDNIDGIINIYTIIDGEVHAYYNVSFYGLGNELLLTQIVPGRTTDPKDTLFTEEYLINYNTNENPGWINGTSITRIGFGGWREIKAGTYNLNNITSNIELHADKITQARMDYYILDEDPNTDPHRIYKYYDIGQPITSYYNNEETFIRDYYLYSHDYWTLEGTNYKTTAPNATEGRTNIATEPHIKTDSVESLYDVYRRELAQYNVYIYNTFIDDAREPILIGRFADVNKKTVLPSPSNANSNIITYNELENWNPTSHPEIAIFDPNQSGEQPFYTNDINKADSQRKFRFLGWKPNINANSTLKVTGDMHIQLVYYCVDDIFTRYFLNNIDELTLPDNITNIPEGGFLHSSNLRILRTKANLIKKFSFCNQAPTSASNMKYYIFTNASDIYLEDYCFYGLRNANIIFYTTGTVYVNPYAFAEMYNCNILIPYSPTLIKINNQLNYFNSSTALATAFTNFFSTQDINHLYVNGTAFRADTYQQGIPTNLLDSNFNNSINTDHIHIGALQNEGETENLEIVNTILQGAGINDIQFTI